MKNKDINFLSVKKHFFLLRKGARLKTLPAIISPIVMASAWAFHQTGVFKKEIFFFTLLSALSLQIATNFFNDAMDFKEGIDSSLRTGPLRLAQSGKASFALVRLYGFLFCFFAVLCGLPLILRGGWPILLLGLFSCLLSYFYTAGPFSLLKIGLAEFCCLLFFGLGAVGGSYYLQTLTLDFSLIYLGIQCGLWALSILLINYLRDEKEDRAGGRKHFVAVYGRTHSLFFLYAIQAFLYLFCFFWIGQGLLAGAWTFFLAPLSAGLLYFISTSPPSSKYNLYLALCSLLYVLFGCLWSIGLFI